jgi:6-phosphogluconolactonase
VLAFRIQDSSGSSTAVFTSPFVIGNSPSGIVIDPSNQFAYVANQLDNTISLLKIDPVSGALTEVLPRTTTGISPNTLAFDPTAKFLYVAEQGSNDVRTYSVGSNHALTLVSTATLGSSPSGLAMPLSGSFLYVPVPNFSAIYAFSVSAGSLTPVAGSPFIVANGAPSAAINQAGTLLYVPNPSTNTVSGFSVQTDGSLTGLQTSPYSDCTASTTQTACTGLTPVAAIVSQSGQYLYVANYQVTTLSQFTITGSGALTALSSASPTAGTNPSSLLFDNKTGYLLAVNVGGKSISELTVNANGSLASTTNTIQVGAVPRGVALTQ